jgi:hypothetical protein
VTRKRPWWRRFGAWIAAALAAAVAVAELVYLRSVVRRQAAALAALRADRAAARVAAERIDGARAVAAERVHDADAVAADAHARINADAAGIATAAAKGDDALAAAVNATFGGPQ